MRILFVHGIAQGGKDRAQLEKVWVETLQEGFDQAGKPWPKDLAVDFPFYGDVLDAFVREEDLPRPDDVLAKGAGGNDEFEVFTQAALDEMQQDGPVTEAEVQAQMDPATSQEKGIQNWGWVRAIARAIDRRLTPVSEFTIEHFLREVFVYTARKHVTKEINDIVVEKLTGEPTVVVGHSLGTVVAYNVLRQGLAGRDIRGFVTVGSPLGLKTLAPTLGVLGHPVPQAGWFNAYDHRDIVALHPLESPYFKVKPLIANHGKVNNSTDNRHGIIGYLNDRQVAERIAQAMA